MQSQNCFACAYAVNPPYKLAESAHWNLYLSEDQTYLGRSYLTLKAHKPSLSSLSQAEWQDYQSAVKVIEATYARVFGFDVFNWACNMNNAFLESPALPHVHWHIWPRHRQPINIGHMQFVDTQFGYHYDVDARRKLPTATVKAIHRQLSEAISKATIV